MLVWLKGVGRSQEDLSRLLSESHDNPNPDASQRYRRAHDRQELVDAYGTLVYKETKIPCHVLELSAGGCSLLTEKPFRPGALAPVELILPILGMILQISGTTQWINKECHMGIQFNHASPGSMHQLKSLISCLRGQSTPEFVRDSIASDRINQALGDVLAVPEESPASLIPSLPTVRPARGPYDKAIHCGAARLYAQDDDEWPVVFRILGDRFNLKGNIIDLSIEGCTIHTAKAFEGQKHDQVEIDLAMQGMHFLIAGVTQASYGPESIGVQFTAMNDHRRQQLALLLVELCAASNNQLMIG
jgi:hypothetical protein